MPIPNLPSLAASLLGSSLLGGRKEAERGPALRPAPAEPLPASAETQSGPDFKEVVRANLHAAAQHAMLGHKAPSFRECPPHLLPERQQHGSLPGGVGGGRDGRGPG